MEWCQEQDGFLPKTFDHKQTSTRGLWDLFDALPAAASSIPCMDASPLSAFLPRPTIGPFTRARTAPRLGLLHRYWLLPPARTSQLVMCAARGPPSDVDSYQSNQLHPCSRRIGPIATGAAQQRREGPARSSSRAPRVHLSACELEWAPLYINLNLLLRARADHGPRCVVPWMPVHPSQPGREKGPERAGPPKRRRGGRSGRRGVCCANRSGRGCFLRRIRCAHAHTVHPQQHATRRAICTVLTDPSFHPTHHTDRTTQEKTQPSPPPSAWHRHRRPRS